MALYAHSVVQNQDNVFPIFTVMHHLHYFPYFSRNRFKPSPAARFAAAAVAAAGKPGDEPPSVHQEVLKDACHVAGGQRKVGLVATGGWELG